MSLGAGGWFIADAAGGTQSTLVLTDPARVLDTRDPTAGFVTNSGTNNSVATNDVYCQLWLDSTVIDASSTVGNNHPLAAGSAGGER